MLPHRLATIVTFGLAMSVALAKPAPPPPAPPPPEQQVLALVNQYRATAGLPVVQLDAKASAGCMEHADYMRRNRGTQAMVGLNAHHQDPKLPGATAAGAACGVAADLFPGVSDLGSAVDGWMSGLYHRRPILTPALKTIGVGYAALPDGTLMAALMFVDGDADGPAGWPVAYPARDQVDLPLEFGNEIPNPVPGGGTGGYPITLQFPPFDQVTAVAAKLVDATGAAVPFYLSTPEQPATSFGQYGVVCVIPKLGLRPGARYTASVTATWGKAAPHTWTWSFSTVGLRKADASDGAALLTAVGHPSLVHGVVKYGGMMNPETVFLLIGESEGTHYQMVSILIPIAAWRELAHDAKPDTWLRAIVDVETTPRIVEGKYLNLPIAQASQLHVTAAARAPSR